MSIISHWLSHFAPPPKVTTSTWAEQNLVLPASTNAKPGKLKLEPYQAQMIDRATAPGVRVAVFQLASQTGKSLSIDALLLDRIVRDPGPVLHVSPTDQKARGFVKERLDPLVRESPNLRGIFGTGRRGGDSDNLSFKAFAGGFLAVASSHKPDDLAARACRYVFLDEIDRYALNSGVEGSPDLLAIKRQHTFGDDAFTVIASTPTDSTSRIAAWHSRGDQAKFFVPCLACGDMAPLDFDRLRWTAGKPEAAYLACNRCAAPASDLDRRVMLSRGEWRPTATGEPGVASFHANVLVSGFTTLAAVAQAAEAADRDAASRRVFWNTSRGEIYVEEGSQLEAGPLQQGAVTIAEPYPDTLQFVTAGVDVQGDRIECTYLAHGRTGSLAVLDHLVLMGDISGPAVWADLDKALGATFKTVDGRTLTLAAVGIDSGYAAGSVYDFVAAQRAKRRYGVSPIKGTSGFDKQRLKFGAKLVQGFTLLLVGVDSLKADVCKRLSRDSATFDKIYLPNHLDEGYFDGLAAEHLVTDYVRGVERKRWHKAIQKNEPLDCLVYAIAIADRVPDSVKNPSKVGTQAFGSKLRLATSNDRPAYGSQYTN